MYWEVIEIKARDEERQQNKVSDFIRDYLTTKNNKIPNKERVYFEFKEKYPTTSIDALEKVLKDIKPMVEIYHKLLNPKYEQDKEIQLQLTYLKLLDVSVTFPFLMQVYKDYIDTVIDKSTFIAVLETVQSYIWRRFIVGYQTTGLNKVFMNLHEKVDKDNYLYTVQKALVEKPNIYRFPKNTETEIAFKQKDVYNINSSNRMYLFERIENHLNREKVTINNNEDLTIEHIFPQNPDIWWQINLGEQECAAIKEKYLHTIGNLTISGNNGALGNKPFSVKKEMNKDGKEQGYQFSRLWLNRDLKEKTIWNVETIKQRTETIAKRFLEIWQFPDIPIVEEQNNEMNIFEADEPKGKKLQYIIFFDEKYDINNITKLYVFVFSQLFELKATTFFTTELGQKAWISNNKIKLRKPTPLHLNSNYFIDTHSASTEKFDRIKKALEIFGYEDKLIIKYAEDEDNDEMGGLFS
jgi:hypothetical protein